VTNGMLAAVLIEMVWIVTRVGVDAAICVRYVSYNVAHASSMIGEGRGSGERLADGRSNRIVGFVRHAPFGCVEGVRRKSRFFGRSLALFAS